MTVFSAYRTYAEPRDADAASDAVNGSVADVDSAEGVALSIETLLSEAVLPGRPQQWAWYRADETLHLEGQGRAQLGWPESIVEAKLEAWLALLAHGPRRKRARLGSSHPSSIATIHR